jgi:hypothetical protein
MIIITNGQREETQEGNMEREILTQSTHDICNKIGGFL